MSQSESVVFSEVDDNEIGIIKLERPKANALSGRLLGELNEVAQGYLKDPPKAVVIHGGEKIFAAGADISEFGGPSEAIELSRLFHEALDAIAAIPRVTIAAINGFALGGGCELALACDFRVAASNAKLGQPEILLGIIPGGGGTQRLPRLIGVSRAKELIYSGRQVSADEALDMGLVDKLADPGNALSVAYDWALEFSKGAVLAQGMAKKVIDAGIATTIQHGLDLERLLFATSFDTSDAATGISSFLENGPGKATFRGE